MYSNQYMHGVVKHSCCICVCLFDAAIVLWLHAVRYDAISIVEQSDLTALNAIAILYATCSDAQHGWTRLKHSTSHAGENILLQLPECHQQTIDSQGRKLNHAGTHACT